MVMLVATFILLRSLGSEQFGLFTIVLTITAMSSLLGLGTSALIVREAASRLQSTGPSTVCNALREALSVLLAMSVLAAAGMFCFYVLQTQLEILHVTEQEQYMLVIVAGLGCAAAHELDLLYGGALKGLSRFGWSAAIEIGGRLIWLLGVLFGARFGNLEGALLASLIVLLCKAIVKGLLCAHFTATPLVFLPSADVRCIGALLRRSTWLWVQGLGGILLFSVDRLIVGNLFGAAVMGHYVACTQLVAFGLMMPAAAGQVLVPWFLQHCKMKSAPAYGWRRSLWMIALAATVPGLLIAASSYLSLSLWLGADIAKAYWSVLTILATGTAAVAAAVPFHFCLLAVGATRSIALANLAGGIMCTMLSVALANFGLIAFSFGKLAYAVPLIFLPYFIFRLLSSQTPDVDMASR